MLKLVLTLLSDWNAYRRAMGRGESSGLFRRLCNLGEVSVWPLENWPTLAMRN